MKNVHRPAFVFLGGHPLVDFVNTVVVSHGERVDLLGSFDDFLSWEVESGILPEGYEEELRRRVSRLGQKPKTFKEAIGLRKLFEEMLESLRSGGRFPSKALDTLNELLSHGGTYEQIAFQDGKFSRSLHARFETGNDLIVPLALAASDFLCNARPEFIRKCENPECILYFYDTTKNHRRRWCSMDGCGNRMKAARFYQKHHEAGG
jgi:predicted RNA-binding Zn ribbon-like protein